MKNKFNRSMIRWMFVMFLLFHLNISTIQAQTYAEIDDVDGKYSFEQLLKTLPPAAHLRDPYLILVNPLNPLKSDLDFTQATIQERHIYNADIQEPLEQLMGDAQDAGFDLVVISAYRSIEDQTKNRQASVNGYIYSGYSLEEAERLTSQYIAPNNASEHNTGLVFDWLDRDWLNQGRTLEEAYENQASAKWLAQNAHKYGFILRYPRGKEHITTFNFEPWHFRYVGVEHATYIYENQLVLEEYLRLLHEDDFRQALSYRARVAAEESVK